MARDWSAGSASNHPDLGAVVQELARELHFLEHPGYAPIPGGALVWGEEPPSPALAVAYLEACVRQATPTLGQWLERAQEQLESLGLSVSPQQRQQVAYRLANTAAALGHQEQLIEAGRYVAPLVFPDPPQGRRRLCAWPMHCSAGRNCETPPRKRSWMPSDASRSCRPMSAMSDWICSPRNR